MKNLKIKAETATPELSVVLDERHQRTDNNPEGRFSEKLHHLLFPHHPYGVPVIGWKHEIEKLSVADAEAFYRKYYAPNNAVVVISGDVTVEDVMRLAASIYGGVSRQNVPAPPSLDKVEVPLKNTYKMVDAGVLQPQLTRLTVVPSYKTALGREAYAYEVLSQLLDGGETGWLYRRLVVELALASGVEAEYDPDARGPSVFGIALTPHPGIDLKDLNEKFNAEFAKCAEKGFDADSVEKAKKRLMRQAVFARDSLMMPGYAFGMALSTGHKVDDVEDWPERIKSVQVEDVNKALATLTKDPHTITGFLEPDPHASAKARQAAQPALSHDMGIR